jgi:Tol biopolymer transport system component
VRRFTLSPNGSRVIYTSSQEVENRDELFSVPVENGQPIKLSGALPAGGNVSLFHIDKGSSVVVYLADQDVNDVFELYSAPLAGGSLKKLNAPLVAGGDVLDDFRISPNAQFAVYRADQEANDRYELFSAPLGSGSVEKLNGPLAASSSVDYFRLSPVLNIATYVANQEGAFELYSVQLNGNPIGKLSAPLAPGQRVTFSDITPDGQRMAYVIGSGFFGGADGILYSVSIFGGASSPLSPTPAADGGVTYFRLSPDSKSAVFGYRQEEAGAERLYTAALDGSGRLPLYDVAQDHGLYDLAVSPDSAWVVFSDYDTTSGANNQIVYAVPLSGGAPVQLSGNSENAFSPLAGPKSDRVLFRTYVPGDPSCEESNLYSAQIFGGARRELTAICGTRGNIDQARWSEDGNRILLSISYDDAQRQDAGFELFISDGQAVPPTPTATSPQPTSPQPSVQPTTPGQTPDNELYLPLLRK